jgi:hypothetical protein
MPLYSNKNMGFSAFSVSVLCKKVLVFLATAFVAQVKHFQSQAAFNLHYAHQIGILING